MKHVRFLLLLSLALLAPRPTLQAAPRGGAEEAFRDAFAAIASADELRQVGNPGGARALYEEALTRLRTLSATYPDWQSGMVRFRMEYCAKQVERLADAPADVPTPPGAAAARPAGAASGPRTTEGGDTPAALCRQARGHLTRAEPEDARKVLLQALALDPDDFTTRSLLAITQCLMGRYHDAALVLEELLTETPNDIDVRVALAAAYAGQERYSDAVAQLRQAIARAPERQDPHYNLAQILAAGEHPDLAGAREHYRRSLELGGGKDPEFEAILEEPPAPAAQ